MVLPNPLLKLLTNARLGLEEIASETKRPARKKHLAGSVVRLGFHDLVAGGRERLFRIAQHHPGVPRDDVVADLMGLVPAVLEERQILVEQDPLLVGQIQGLQAEILDRVAQERRAEENLKTCDLHARESLPQKAVVGRRIVAAVELQQVPDNAQIDGRLRVAKTP
ncbi:hypothetical protein [Bradyrhizobium sp. RDI18]|uniref:hypothetical protein n=1 Tax=Bradyrhizobium sp. RDI18 TaxID=3367400 RepID=UPI00371101CE